MAAIPSLTTTWVLPGLDPNATYYASVAGVDATATTIAFTCQPLSDLGACAVMGGSLTFGQNAQVTPPPSASTGVLDSVITLNAENGAGVTVTGSALSQYIATMSSHCTLTHFTELSVCTSVQDGHTRTMTVGAVEASAYHATAIPFTITAGFGSLPTSGSASISGTSTSSGSAAADTASSSPSSSAASTSSPSGHATNLNAAEAGALSLLALLAAFFVR